MRVSACTSSSVKPFSNASPTYQMRSGPGSPSSFSMVWRSVVFWFRPSTPTSRPRKRLLERFLERPPDRHHFADRLHLRGEAIARLRKLLEREARDLGHDVVDRRLERRRRQPARDLVAQFVQRVADRQLGGDLRDRKAGRLRCERRRARHARIHLDHHHAPGRRVDRELHVRAAGVDADLAQHRDRGVAHDLVFLVRQRLRRGDGDRVAGVHAHRIEVLDGADDDAVVARVAHHLHLELLPADHRLLDQELLGRRRFQPALADGEEFLAVVGDATARAAERERRPDHGRITDHRLHLERFLERVGERGARTLEPDALHRELEFLAVLRLVDRLLARADHLDAVLLEHAVLREIERAVERSLAAHRRQQRIRPLDLDHLLHHLPRDGLDVSGVRHLRVGHDGGRIRVHQDYPVPLLAQRLARLRAGIVELARLADHDRTRADDQDAVEVGALRHIMSKLAPSARGVAPGVLAGLELLDEAVEEIVDVVRAGARLRVALEAERRSVHEAETLQAAVEEGHVGHFRVGGKGRRIDREAVVLARDQHASRFNVLHRMVRAVVAELHLHRLRARRQRQQLMAEADAEDRQPGIEQLADGADRVVAGLGIARSVRQEDRRRGPAARTCSADVCAGTTVIRQPRLASLRRMLFLMP